MANRKQYATDERFCVMLQGLRLCKIDSVTTTIKGATPQWFIKIGYKSHQDSIYYGHNRQAARNMYNQIRRALEGDNKRET